MNNDRSKIVGHKPATGAGHKPVEEQTVLRIPDSSELQHCATLNGLALPDPIVGYTRNATSQLEKQGVCEDLDASVARLGVFGSAYQFKDTPGCRGLVNKFNCLSWAAANNACPNAPLPPCRSMCVEIADTCVFTPLYELFLNEVCTRFACADSAPTGCIPGTNEQMPSFNRCTLHDDYRRLALSSAPRGLLDKFYVLLLLFIGVLIKE
ncbi:hypothetical protein SPRG_06478 [Saprolegnia parasitica CBS 223.65]|uniref:FZ domain-containing protein n=1 Tax=Saprolegnia parasitica (strain CBS 223.65) TaxID=695850 RepID=A0A067CP93_SAPPC|nr:hypothetical protein SPRG_06478 [Saprolegnia parasitica CBS 223.65]KDO28622.1 hypothetical protein SPRG_06478 [Saprolegnia parasitica CBS 223.65]|eukprot:XP_012200685.1 hypothetical protein SPRG_06478 [Saprolegnia parasitica CBS 223.65]